MDKQTKDQQDGMAVLVSLAEIGYQVGGSRDTARSFAVEQGVTIRRNWADDEAVTLADADRLRRAWGERMAALRQREAQYEKWREQRQAEFQRRLEEEARQRRAQQERELAAARDEARREMEARFRQEQSVRAAERAKREPDVSREAWTRETGGR